MKKYETFLKINNKWKFMGWYPIMNNNFILDYNKRGKYTYITYEWLDGNVEQYRYGEYIEE